MRDMRRLEQREGIQFDRSHIVWLTLGSVLVVGLSFALGFVVGQRSERISITMAGTDEPGHRLEKETQRHRELTFYSDLSKKEKAAAEQPRKSPAALAVPAPKKAAPAEKKREAVSVDSTTPRNEARAALDSGPSLVGDYTIQVSSFQTMEEAKAYSASLERKGFRPFIVAAEIRKKGTWYRVRLGRFKDEGTAQAAKRILLNADIPAWVLKTE